MKEIVLATALLASNCCHAALSPLLRSTQTKLPLLAAAVPKLVRSISLDATREEIQKHYASKNIVTKNPTERFNFIIQQLNNCKNEAEKETLRKRILPQFPTIDEKKELDDIFNLHASNTQATFKKINSKQDLLDWQKELEKSSHFVNKLLMSSLGTTIITLMSFTMVSETLYHTGLGISFAGIGIAMLKGNSIEGHKNFIKKELEILNN